MKITILGAGCSKCRQTAEVVRQAVERAAVDTTIDKVEDEREIMRYRVIMTPAIAIDGMVRISSRVPTVEEIQSLLSEDPGR